MGPRKPFVFTERRSMSYYKRSSRESPGNTLWILLGVLAVLLIAAGLCVNAVVAAQTRSVKTDLEAIEARRVQLVANLEKAEGIYTRYSSDFASHWSDNFPPAFHQARADVDEDGRVANLLASAWEIVDKDQGVARSQADEASLLVKAGEDLVVKILGPPAYYDELARKDREAESWVSQVDYNISSATASLNVLKVDNWNSTHGVVFGRSYRRLTEAITQLNAAKESLVRHLQGDNVEVDKPWAYDEASAAQVMVDEANAWATTDHTKSREADSAIVNADVAITNARATVFFANYNQSGAQATLNSAVATLASARSAFAGGAGLDPNYQQALDLAVLARSQANQAVQQTVPPTETPVPPPTVVPVVYDDDDSSSSGSDPDWWTDSGGGDTTDDGGSSDYWESDDGGTDIFDSDDGGAWEDPDW